VSGNFFSGLQVRPIMGRMLTLKDEATHAPIAVLNYGWWKGRFAGDKDVLGKTFYVKGVPVLQLWVSRLLGSMAWIRSTRSSILDSTAGTSRLNAWGNAGYGSYFVWLAELACVANSWTPQQGVSPEQAQARLKPPFENALANASPVDPNEQKPVLVLSGVRGVENLRDDYEHPLRFLMSMVALVLLIACANVVMLLLARNAGRASEFCLRRALGANKRALFLQMLGESMVLVVAGAALGCCLRGRDASASGMVWRRHHD